MWDNRYIFVIDGVDSIYIDLKHIKIPRLFHQSFLIKFQDHFIIIDKKSRTMQSRIFDKKVSIYRP